MTFRRTTRTLSNLAGVILLASCQQAMAQYVWIDDKGVKQLSDRPPPPWVPDKRILKAPGKPRFHPNAVAASAPAAAAVPVADTDSAAALAEVPATAPPALAARDQAFKQRRADAAAAEKKAGETAQREADIAANCDAARQNQRALDQGIRIANVDQTGERSIMSDAERAEFGKKNQKVLAGCQ